MVREFSAEHVTRVVLSHLERRRYAIQGDVSIARQEVHNALEPVRRVYRDYDLPPSYMKALAKEIADTVPERWCASARRITDLEQRDFGLWRGGDPVARLTYVFFGLLGAAIIAASPVAEWAKWMGLLLAGLSWWMPSFQSTWFRQLYRQSLERMAHDVAEAQPLLERAISPEELLAPAVDASPDAV